ncbi:uncharacterized protein LOC143441778 [Arvicanthis niloticus]|uniref:uncharacterized protein LOC143312007 n=1 Tax=Arvicanthis niloticus TaxID=61156 RepID=UPI00402B215C
MVPRLGYENFGAAAGCCNRAAWRRRGDTGGRFKRTDDMWPAADRAAPPLPVVVAHAVREPPQPLAAVARQDRGRHAAWARHCRRCRSGRGRAWQRRSLAPTGPATRRRHRLYAAWTPSLLSAITDCVNFHRCCRLTTPAAYHVVLCHVA